MKKKALTAKPTTPITVSRSITAGLIALSTSLAGCPVGDIATTSGDDTSDTAEEDPPAEQSAKEAEE